MTQVQLFRRTPFFQLFNELERNLWNQESNQSERVFEPSVDIQQNKEGYLLTVDLPGVMPEDIKIDVKQNTLTLSATRESKTEKKEEHFHRQERFFGKFERSFSLPDHVDPDRIDAHYNNGVLEMFIPKTQEVAAKSIKVQTGTSHNKVIGDKEANH